MTRKISIPKRMASGEYIDLTNYKAKDVDLKSISASLNWVFRFTGHHRDKPPLSVAQHSKLAVQIARLIYPDEPLVALDCCIHDFEESVVGDIATPLKTIIGNQFKEYTDGIASTIYEHLWPSHIAYTRDLYEKRKVCDLISLEIEKRSMWNDGKGKKYWPSIPVEFERLGLDPAVMFDEIQAERFIDLQALYEETLADIE